MEKKSIKTALLSVYHKEGLENIARLLSDRGITIYSTGGTQRYLESAGCKVEAVEDLTSYPSILGGRVKTLHPKVFGGILAIRNEDHKSQLNTYSIPEIDLVVVDLYPFTETVKSTTDEAAIIEKIDIGGISLIRAAAKNYKDVTVVSSAADYKALEKILDDGEGYTTIQERKALALNAFKVSSEYDTAISNYFANVKPDVTQLRYGENPHQEGEFIGDLAEIFEKHGGKELSYNNLVDVDAAVELMQEFNNAKPTFAILKHTNACGVATRDSILEAWNAALAGDPVSAFGGILIANSEIDLDTAKEIDKIFYEVVIAPSFSPEAIHLLGEKKKRIILTQKGYKTEPKLCKTLLNGVVMQDRDSLKQTWETTTVKTNRSPTDQEKKDLLFAEKCAKHLKSNTIVLAKNEQLLGMGCGQTSRVDACQQAIEKAVRMGMSLEGAVMASDAFFPFPDCVEIAHKAGIKAVIQPGGSIKDQLSIDYCNENDLAMVFTGVRHFKH